MTNLSFTNALDANSSPPMTMSTASYENHDYIELSLLLMALAVMISLIISFRLVKRVDTSRHAMYSQYIADNTVSPEKDRKQSIESAEPLAKESLHDLGHNAENHSKLDSIGKAFSVVLRAVGGIMQPKPQAMTAAQYARVAIHEETKDHDDRYLGMTAAEFTRVQRGISPSTDAHESITRVEIHRTPGNLITGPDASRYHESREVEI